MITHQHKYVNNICQDCGLSTKPCPGTHVWNAKTKRCDICGSFRWGIPQMSAHLAEKLSGHKFYQADPSKGGVMPECRIQHHQDDPAYLHKLGLVLTQQGYQVTEVLTQPVGRPYILVAQPQWSLLAIKPQHTKKVAPAPAPIVKKGYGKK